MEEHLGGKRECDLIVCMHTSVCVCVCGGYQVNRRTCVYVGYKWGLSVSEDKRLLCSWVRCSRR